MFFERDRISNCNQRINNILYNRKEIKDKLTLKRDMMKISAKLSRICIRMCMEVVVNFIPQQPRTCASKKFMKHWGRNNGLKPREEQLILLLPGAISLSDMTCIAINYHGKSLRNLEILNEVMKTMTTYHKFDLRLLEEIVYCVKLLYNRVIEMCANWSKLNQQCISIVWWRKTTTTTTSDNWSCHHGRDRWWKRGK